MMEELSQLEEELAKIDTTRSSDASLPAETVRSKSRTTSSQNLALQSLVDEVPWKLLPTLESLPLVDLRQGTHKTTFFIDDTARQKAEVILSSFYEEVCTRSPRPDWVPSDNLSQRSLICVLLRLMERHDLLPSFIENGITDEALPLGLSALQGFLRDTKTIEAFQSLQYKAQLRNLDEDKITIYHGNEIVPFRTIRQLGHGGFATVDCVEHVLRGYEVARKTFMLTSRLEQRMQSSFQTEISSLKKLSGYRHIVEYVGAYQSPYCLGLLLRPVADCDLYQFLKSPKAFGFTEAEQQTLLLRSFGCLSTALAYMHSQKSRFRTRRPPHYIED